jgi:transcriptional regulator with XRE-family HTH domain
MKNINNKLKELRLQRGLKQEEVASWLNIQCTGRISKWERGLAMPSVQNLFKLAKIYKAIPHTMYPNLYSENDDTPLGEP